MLDFKKTKFLLHTDFCTVPLNVDASEKAVRLWPGSPPQGTGPYGECGVYYPPAYPQALNLKLAHENIT